MILVVAGFVGQWAEWHLADPRACSARGPVGRVAIEALGRAVWEGRAVARASASEVNPTIVTIVGGKENLDAFLSDLPVLDAPTEGPSTTLHMAKTMSSHGRDPRLWLERVLREKRIEPSDRTARELRVLCHGLWCAGCFDQLTLGALSVPPDACPTGGRDH